MALLAWLFLLALTGAWAQSRRRSAVRWMAVAGWFALPFYMLGVVVNCPRDCGIRVDFLLVVPVLAILGMAALWSLGADWIKSRIRGS